MDSHQKKKNTPTLGGVGIIFSVLITSLFTINSLAIVSPTREYYVNDYANLSSNETEQYIINTNLNLENKNHII